MQFNEFHAKQSPWVRYATAIVIFICALVLRYSIAPPGSGLVYLTFYPATVFCFYLCGIGPGMVMVVLSTLATDYIFVPPY